jgi:pimeloyl-ACP methyl ester carboxylesterase
LYLICYKTDMSLFCLVHGSTQNTSGWDLLALELARLGHESMRAALPTDCPGASATVYADAIAGSLNGDDAIVVAHSASGAFLPLVPSRHKIRRMVFLGAIVPQPGTSIIGQIQADPTVLNPAWIGKDPTKDEKLAREFLFHDCSEEVYRWALTTRALTLARQAMIEICPLTEWPGVPASYIVCSEDRTIQPQWQRKIAREFLNVEPFEIAAGHCPHVSRPVELARILSDL